VSSDIAHGEAVGPVKVCKEFAAEVLNMIDADVSVGRMKNTIYNVFNDIAKYIPIYGANITGLRWCEVDTTEDLELAQKMFGEKTPFVVLMYGYPATGKTTMSRALQEYCSQFGRTSLISTFNLREELGLVDLYSVDERTAIYSEMMERVTKVMSWKKSNVILDGNFNKFDVRQKIYDAARKQGYQVFVVHCSVENREEINRRVEKRKSLSRNMEHGAANLNLYELIKNTTDDLSKDIMGVPQMSVIKVDTHTDAIEISQVGMMTENVSMIQNGVKLGLVKK
jgi:predicted kinase